MIQKYFQVCVLCTKSSLTVQSEINCINNASFNECDSNELFYQTPMCHCCRYNAITEMCETELTYPTNPTTRENYKFQRVPGRVCPVRVSERCKCRRVFDAEEKGKIDRLLRRIKTIPLFDTIIEVKLSDVETE